MPRSVLPIFESSFAVNCGRRDWKLIRSWLAQLSLRLLYISLFRIPIARIEYCCRCCCVVYFQLYQPCPPSQARSHSSARVSTLVLPCLHDPTPFHSSLWSGGNCTVRDTSQYSRELQYVARGIAKPSVFLKDIELDTAAVSQYVRRLHSSSWYSSSNWCALQLVVVCNPPCSPRCCCFCRILRVLVDACL